jgi:hypothetical protein
MISDEMHVKNEIIKIGTRIQKHMVALKKTWLILYNRTWLILDPDMKLHSLQSTGGFHTQNHGLKPCQMKNGNSSATL